MSRFISNDEILHRGKFAPKPVAIKVTVTPAPVAPVEVKAEPVIEPEVEEGTKNEITEEQSQVREEVNTISENIEITEVADAAEVKAEPETPVEEAPKPKKAPAKKKSTAKAKTDAE